MTSNLKDHSSNTSSGLNKRMSHPTSPTTTTASPNNNSSIPVVGGSSSSSSSPQQMMMSKESRVTVTEEGGFTVKENPGTGADEEDPSSPNSVTAGLVISHSDAAASSSSSSHQQQHQQQSSKAGGMFGSSTPGEVAFLLLANVVSVVGVVAVNKKVYQMGFLFPSTLMTMHFICTFAFVVFFHKLGYFTEKKIDTIQYVKLGAAQVGSVALVNLSLLFNSVGMYQLMKFLVIFVTCLIEYMYYRKVYSLQVYGVLVGLVISVSLATITSLQFSSLGFIFGVAGAFTTSLYQIMNKHIQTEYSVNAMQLLLGEQPYSAGWCGLLAVVTEHMMQTSSSTAAASAAKSGSAGGNTITQIDWSPGLVGMIALSCVLAFGVNLTVYLIIGKTNPITYSVVGHIKTVSVFGVGYFFLGDKISMSQGFWMMLAFGFIVLYGFVTTPGAASASSSSSAGSSSSSSSQPAGAADKRHEK